MMLHVRPRRTGDEKMAWLGWILLAFSLPVALALLRLAGFALARSEST